MARGYFVTGTDTGIGKTHIALGLVEHFKQRGLKTAVMKPVSADCEATSAGLRNDDAVQLMQSANVELPYDIVNPYAFAPPIAPHIAAAEIGVQMELSPLAEAYRTIAGLADVVIVEGAGGWLVPFNDKQTMADVAGALGLSVILVVGIRLGCLNHALLTAESIRSHGLSLAGWVANHVQPSGLREQDNIETLKARLDAPCIGEIPYQDAGGPERLGNLFNPPN